MALRNNSSCFAFFSLICPHPVALHPFVLSSRLHTFTQSRFPAYPPFLFPSFPPSTPPTRLLVEHSFPHSIPHSYPTSHTRIPFCHQPFPFLFVLFSPNPSSLPSSFRYASRLPHAPFLPFLPQRLFYPPRCFLSSALTFPYKATFHIL